MRLRQTRHFGGAASRIDRAPHDDEIAWCEGILCFGHQGRGNDRGRCRLADGQHGDADHDRRVDANDLRRNFDRNDQRRKTEDQPDVVDVLEREELLGYLRDGLNELPSRQQRIILGQFLEGRTTAELATELGVTRSRVSQLRTVALHELRRSISAHYSMPSSSVPSSSLSSSAGERVDQAEVSVRSVASA